MVPVHHERIMNVQKIFKNDFSIKSSKEKKTKTTDKKTTGYSSGEISKKIYNIFYSSLRTDHIHTQTNLLLLHDSTVMKTKLEQTIFQLINFCKR